jgi:hypothetical protein
VANKQFKFAALRYFNASGCAMDGTLGEDHDPETHLIPVIFQAIAGQRPALHLFGTDYPTKDGTNVRDYIHVDDLADAHIAAMGRLTAGKPIISARATVFPTGRSSPPPRRSPARKCQWKKSPAVPATPSRSTPILPAPRNCWAGRRNIRTPIQLSVPPGTGFQSTRTDMKTDAR